MVAVKAHQAASFLKAPDQKHTAFLLYGTDPGLVSERAVGLTRLLSDRETPPGEIIRLDDLDLENDPDRLSVELLTMPMFGGRKVVRINTSRRVTTLTLAPLVAEKSPAATLVVEAGNLKADDKLRQLFEKSATAAAIACYGDDAQDLDGVIRDVLQKNGLQISASARQLLLARLGADRVLSRGEIEKLALYASGKGQIDDDDVEAIVGDAAELTMDRVVQAAALGNSEKAVAELARALAAGESAQGIILATQRHFTRLHRIRTAVDAGRPVDAAISDIKPPIHFKQKDVLAAQCRAWRTPVLETALAGIAVAARTARTAGNLEDALAERLVLTLARLARA